MCVSRGKEKKKHQKEELDKSTSQKNEESVFTGKNSSLLLCAYLCEHPAANLSFVCIQYAVAVKVKPFRQAIILLGHVAIHVLQVKRKVRRNY